jgi:hypothetical protein
VIPEVLDRCNGRELQGLVQERPKVGLVPTVFVPAERLERWVANFRDRHGDTGLAVVDGGLAGTAADGSTFLAQVPFGGSYTGTPDATALAAEARPPAEWGVLLARKGGFAIARMRYDELVDSKVGQRHVQGRTKAGGQSQQRFARRRGNQARQAYEAAADHAARILGSGALVVVTGGDRTAIDEVLQDPRMRAITVVGPWLPVPDPKRSVLEQAVRDAMAVRIEVENAGE